MNTDMKKQTVIQLLRESIDSEIKLGTKMVVNWDMYLVMEKEQRFQDLKKGFQAALDSLQSANNLFQNETYGGDK